MEILKQHTPSLVKRGFSATRLYIFDGINNIFILFTVLFFVSCQNPKEKKEQLFSIKTDKYSLVISKIENKVKDGKVQCSKYVNRTITDSSFYVYGKTIKGLLQSLKDINTKQIEDKNQLLPMMFLEVDCQFQISKKAIKDTIIYHLLDFFKLKERTSIKQKEVLFLKGIEKKTENFKLSGNIESNWGTIVFENTSLTMILNFLNQNFPYYFKLEQPYVNTKYSFKLSTSENLEGIIKILKQAGIKIRKEKTSIVFYNYEKI